MQDHSRLEVLQEGVNFARATLAAIAAAEMFAALPSDKVSIDLQNHGSWLLTMLRHQLDDVQDQIDASYKLGEV